MISRPTCLGNILKPHPEEKQESRMENEKIQAGKKHHTIIYFPHES